MLQGVRDADKMSVITEMGRKDNRVMGIIVGSRSELFEKN
jgi:hypothetical protein